jgi:hypothetical protein
MEKGLIDRLQAHRHLAAAIGWMLLLLYSIYLSFDAIAGARPLSVIHVVIPLALLLVAIRACRRFLAHGAVGNGQNKRDS